MAETFKDGNSKEHSLGDGMTMPKNLIAANFDDIDIGKYNVKFDAGTDISAASFVNSSLTGLKLCNLKANPQTNFDGANLSEATIDEKLLNATCSYDNTKFNKALISRVNNVNLTEDASKNFIKASMGNRNIKANFGGLFESFKSTLKSFLSIGSLTKNDTFRNCAEHKRDKGENDSAFTEKARLEP